MRKKSSAPVSVVSLPGDAQVLESVLGYRFSDRDLLIRALTHKSLASEKRSTGAESTDNERLEFLGDAVLGFVVSTALVEQYPGYPEGRLSMLRAGIVSASHLAEVAQLLKLGDYLHLGRGEERSGGRAKIRLLANALEALIAAIYLDGGLEAARRFVLGHVARDLDAELQLNYKELLQDRANELGLPSPRYTIVASSGPDHSKQFVVEAHFGIEHISRGEGPSKKVAGQDAARAMLELLRTSVSEPRA